MTTAIIDNPRSTATPGGYQSITADRGCTAATEDLGRQSKCLECPYRECLEAVKASRVAILRREVTELEAVKEEKRLRDNAYARAYYHRNKKRVQARVLAWREANPEKHKVVAARALQNYYRRNCDKICAKRRAARKADPDVARAYERAQKALERARDPEGSRAYHREYYAKNRERIAAHRKVYREAHKDKINAKRREQRRAAKEVQA